MGVYDTITLTRMRISKKRYVTLLLLLILQILLYLFHYRYKLGFCMLVPFKIFIFYEIARSDFGISDFGLNSHTKKTPYAN